MEQRLIVFVKYYLFWILFFVIQKPVFMLWNYTLLGNDVSWQDWFLVPWHGLIMDWSVASYIIMLVGLLLCASFWINASTIERIVDGLTGLLLAVALIVMIGDNGCFPSWGYHLDRTVLMFLRTPADALACAPWWMWGLGLVALILLWLGCWKVYQSSIMNHPLANLLMVDRKKKAIYTLELLLLSGLCFIPARGGLGVSTMNTGRVYFSDNQILNMAAINPIFNIMESAGEPDIDVDRYTYMPSKEAHQTVDSLLTNAHQSTSYFTTTRPNVVLVIAESFSYSAMKAGAMPCLRRLSEQGIFFSEAYAGSYRTDRGVVCVMSGCPGQPTSSLMIMPAKSQQLPQLGKVLKQEGYDLHFYYGGDEDFTNMRSYLVQGGFENRMSDQSFARTERMGKWGVPDHILLKTAAQQIASRYQTVNGPYLDVVLTLSSNEPFEVEYDLYENPYLNSVAYADSCIGAFVDSLRVLPEWQNTIVAIVADHGYPYPAHISNVSPEWYHIPMMLVGGALREHKTVDRICGQIDLVPTILSQMDLPTDAYPFSKNILDTTNQSFAFYAFNDGFGLILPNDKVVVDAKVNQMVIGSNSDVEHQARAFIQCVMEYVDSL